MKYLTIPILLLVVVCLCFLSWHVSAPHDIWWQMANGRLIAETGELITADSYTFTINGNTYHDKYWLYEILTYNLHNTFGWTGLTFLRMTLVLAAFGSLMLNMKRKPLWLLMILAVPALILIDLRILLRAYWFTLILLPIFLRLATKIFLEKNYSAKNIGLLCAVEIAWANLHGEFFWGFAIIGLFFADNAIRTIKHNKPSSDLLKPGACMLLLLMSSCINPLGIKLITGLISEARLVAINTLSTEWMPFMTVAQPINWAAWIALILLTAFSIWKAQNKRSTPLVIMFVFFALLSQYSLRFIGVFTMVSLFIAMEHGQHIRLSKKADKMATAIAPILSMLAIMTIIWTVCLGHFYKWQAEHKFFGSGIITSEFPVKSSEFLRNNNIKGSFINSWSHGGYLIWNNSPDIKIAEDGRTSPFPAKLSARIRAITKGNDDDLESFMQEFSPDGAIVPWQYARMLSMLSDKSDWRLLFVGPNSSVWMTDKALAAQNKQHLSVDINNLEKFLVSNQKDSFKEESFLSFFDHANRRAVFFDAVGRKDLANKQVTLAR